MTVEHKGAMHWALGHLYVFASWYQLQHAFSLTCHHCLRELCSAVIGTETHWQWSKTSIAIWPCIFLKIQFSNKWGAFNWPEPSQNIAVKFAYLLYNLTFGKKNIWPTVHLGYFHSTKNITIILILWLSGNFSDYNTSQVIMFLNAYMTSMVCAHLF